MYNKKILNCRIDTLGDRQKNNNYNILGHLFLKFIKEEKKIYNQYDF